MNKQEKTISRKDFLKGVGVTLAGATVLGGLSPVGAQSAAEAGPVDYPVPYSRIDPDEAAKRAYHYYKEKGG